MNFAIPRDKPAELILYLWKIIDLPEISMDDLLFKISFDLFLLSPQKARDFIQLCLKNNFLVQKNKETVSLSPELSKKLENWQNESAIEIKSKLASAKKKIKIIQNLEKNKESSNFNQLLKIFLEKGTINRAVSVSDSAFKMSEFNLDKGILEAEVAGSEEKPYIIEIKVNDKILKHNCDDFETKRAKNKKFCKHLAKLFLILKEKNEKSAIIILKNIVENLEEWEFLT
jgi:uncharacterized Zn finger protein